MAQPITLLEAEANDYAALRSAINPHNHPVVKVLGYRTPFDGGGGVFVRELNNPPKTDDDGRTVLSAITRAYYWRKWL